MPRVEKRRRHGRKVEFAVEFVERGARRLLTTEPGNAVCSEKVDGAIVRVAGNESHTTADLTATGQALVELGASAFKVLSAPARPDLKSTIVENCATSTHASPRAAVEAILEAENNVELSEIVEASMSAVGL